MKEQLFTNTFIEDGGIFITSNELFKKFVFKGNQLLKGISRFGNFTKGIPEVYFNFINNPLLNAKATIQNQTGLIGFYAGGFLIIYDLYLKILSHSSTLKHIGDPTLEKFAIPIIRNYYMDANLLIDFGNPDYEEYKQTIPVDKERIAYAYLLFEIAFEFILNHELTHILDGHTSFVDSNQEFKNNLTFQTLEMDADSLSLSKILGHHIRKYKGIINISDGYKPFYSNLNSVVYFVYYSICTLFRIFSENSVYKTSKLTDLIHSKPRIRQFMAGATILEYFNNYFTELKDEFDSNTLGIVIGEMENNFKTVTGLKIDTTGYEEAASDEAKKQLSCLLEHWELIRPKLKNYSFVDLV